MVMKSLSVYGKESGGWPTRQCGGSVVQPGPRVTQSFQLQKMINDPQKMLMSFCHNMEDWKIVRIFFLLGVHVVTDVTLFTHATIRGQRSAKWRIQLKINQVIQYC